MFSPIDFNLILVFIFQSNFTTYKVIVLIPPLGKGKTYEIGKIDWITEY